MKRLAIDGMAVALLRIAEGREELNMPTEIINPESVTPRVSQADQGKSAVNGLKKKIKNGNVSTVNIPAMGAMAPRLFAALLEGKIEKTAAAGEGQNARGGAGKAKDSSLSAREATAALSGVKQQNKKKGDSALAVQQASLRSAEVDGTASPDAGKAVSQTAAEIRQKGTDPAALSLRTGVVKNLLQGRREQKSAEAVDAGESTPQDKKDQSLSTLVKTFQAIEGKTAVGIAVPTVKIEVKQEGTVQEVSAEIEGTPSSRVHAKADLNKAFQAQMREEKEAASGIRNAEASQEKISAGDAAQSMKEKMEQANLSEQIATEDGNGKTSDAAHVNNASMKDKLEGKGGQQLSQFMKTSQAGQDKIISGDAAQVVKVRMQQDGAAQQILAGREGKFSAQPQTLKTKKHLGQAEALDHRPKLEEGISEDKKISVGNEESAKSEMEPVLSGDKVTERAREDILEKVQTGTKRLPLEESGQAKGFSAVVGTEGRQSVNETAPARTQTVIPQIIEGAAQVLKDGSGRVVLTLNPPRLGSLDLDIVVRENKVKMMILAENREVKEIIKANLDDLKSSLQDRGFQVDKLEVLIQERQEGNGSGFRQETGSFGDRTNEDNRAYYGKTESSLPGPSGMRTANGPDAGLISVFA